MKRHTVTAIIHILVDTLRTSLFLGLYYLCIVKIPLLYTLKSLMAMNGRSFHPNPSSSIRAMSPPQFVPQPCIMPEDPRGEIASVDYPNPQSRWNRPKKLALVWAILLPSRIASTTFWLLKIWTWLVPFKHEGRWEGENGIWLKGICARAVASSCATVLFSVLGWLYRLIGPFGVRTLDLASPWW